jgi:hypothetical protein
MPLSPLEAFQLDNPAEGELSPLSSSSPQNKLPSITVKPTKIFSKHLSEESKKLNIVALGKRLLNEVSIQ